MILHRFCSKEEFEAYQRGEVLVNETNHSLTRGNATTSVGFCFFREKPDDAIHILSGIVDLDYCITVEVDEAEVVQSRGRYGNRELNRAEFRKEYCTTAYDNKRFRLVEATTKYSTYAPNHRDLKKLFPFLFV